MMQQPAFCPQTLPSPTRGEGKCRAGSKPTSSLLNNALPTSWGRVGWGAEFDHDRRRSDNPSRREFLGSILPIGLLAASPVSAAADPPPRDKALIAITLDLEMS